MYDVVFFPEPASARIFISDFYQAFRLVPSILPEKSQAFLHG
jgi:hypothetical protein